MLSVNTHTAVARCSNEDMIGSFDTRHKGRGINTVPHIRAGCSCLQLLDGGIEQIMILETCIISTSKNSFDGIKK